MPEPIETHPADPTAPIACTATADRAAGQVREWSDLQQRALDRREIDGGVRLVLPAELTDRVRDLARREAACCSFLTISTIVEDDLLIVEVTAIDEAARPIIAMLAGGGPS